MRTIVGLWNKNIFIRIGQRIVSALWSRKSGIKRHVAITTLAAFVHDVQQAMNFACARCTYSMPVQGEGTQLASHCDDASAKTIKNRVVPHPLLEHSQEYAKISSCTSSIYSSSSSPS